MSAIYTMQYSELPFYLYDYNSGEDKHTGEQEINSEEEIKAIFRVVIPTAISQKRKCIITDKDGGCLFCTEGGEVIFPTPSHIEIMQKYDIPAFLW